MSKPYKNKKQHLKKTTCKKKRLSKLKRNERKQFQTQNVTSKKVFIVSDSERDSTFYKKGDQLRKLSNRTNNSLNKLSIQHTSKSLSSHTEMNSPLRSENGEWSVENLSCIENEVKKHSNVNEITIVNKSSSKLEEIQSNACNNSVRLPTEHFNAEKSCSKEQYSTAEIRKKQLIKCIFKINSHENSHFKRKYANNKNVNSLSSSNENRLQIKRTHTKTKTSKHDGIPKKLKTDHCLDGGSYEEKEINISNKNIIPEGTKIIESNKSSSNTITGSSNRDEIMMTPCQEGNTFLSSHKSSSSEPSVPYDTFKGEVSLNNEVPPNSTVRTSHDSSNEDDLSRFKHVTDVYPLKKNEMLELSDDVDSGVKKLKNSRLQQDCDKDISGDYNSKTRTTINNEKETVISLDKLSGLGANSKSKISDNSRINSCSQDVTGPGSCNSQTKQDKQKPLATKFCNVKDKSPFQMSSINRSPSQMSYISSIIAGPSNSVYGHATSRKKKILKAKEKCSKKTLPLTKINSSKVSKDSFQTNYNSKLQDILVMDNACTQVDSCKNNSSITSELSENVDSIKSSEESPNHCITLDGQKNSSKVRSEALEARLKHSKSADESLLKKNKCNKSKQECSLINPNQITIDFDGSKNVLLPPSKNNDNQNTQSDYPECSDLAEIDSDCSQNVGLLSLKKNENHANKENYCTVNSNMSVVHSDGLTNIASSSLKEKSQNSKQNSVGITDITEIDKKNSKNNVVSPPMKKKKNHAGESHGFDYYFDLTDIDLENKLSSSGKKNMAQTYQGNDTELGNLTNNTKDTHLETEENHKDVKNYCLKISELSERDVSYSVNKNNQDSDETDLDNSNKIGIISKNNNNGNRKKCSETHLYPVVVLEHSNYNSTGHHGSMISQVKEYTMSGESEMVDNGKQTDTVVTPKTKKYFKLQNKTLVSDKTEKNNLENCFSSPNYVHVSPKSSNPIKDFCLEKDSSQEKYTTTTIFAENGSHQGSVNNIELSDNTSPSKARSSTSKSPNKLSNNVHQSQQGNIKCKTTDANEESTTTKTKKKISKHKMKISKMNLKCDCDSLGLSGGNGKVINKHKLSKNPIQRNQSGFIQKSNKRNPLIFTSTPKKSKTSFISKPTDYQKCKQFKELQTESSLMTGLSINSKRNHSKSISTMDESADYQSQVNEVIEEIKNNIIMSDDELKKLDALEIQIDWDLSDLHEVDSGCPEMSTFLKEAYLDLTIITTPFTEEEEETIKKNWKIFSKKYGFLDTDLFVSLPTLYDHLRRSQVLKFQQFMAKGLHNRRLFSVYAKFKEIFSAAPPKNWSRVEDEILLNIHSFTKDQEMDGLVHNVLLPKILGRSAITISNRQYALLKDERVWELTERPVNWTPDLEGELVHQLLMESKVDELEDLRGLTIPFRVWNEVVERMNVSFYQVLDHWRYNLYPRLFSINPVICPLFYMQLIKWVHDADIQKWEEIDWEGLSDVAGGVGAHFACKTLRLLILNFVPYQRHKHFRACIRYLYLYCWPKLLAEENQYTMKRMRYNPMTRLLEDIEDVEPRSFGEVLDVDLSS